MVFGFEVNSILMVLGLLLIIYVLYADARGDRTAEELAKGAVLDVKGELKSEISARGGELDELQLEVLALKKEYDAHLAELAKAGGDMSSIVSDLNRRVETLEKRPAATRPPSPIKVEPVTVEPVTLQIEVSYPPVREKKPSVKKQLEPARRAIRKAVGR